MTSDLIEDALHIPHVIANDWRQRAPGLDLDELTAALNLALVKAAHQFDPDRGDWRTYAWARVRGAAIDHLRAIDHIPRKVRQAIKRGDTEETAAHARPWSLDACLEVGVDPPDPDDFTQAVDHRVDTWPRLRDALAALPARDRQVIIDRYWHEHPIQHIADRLGVHQSRASQIHTATIRRLRAAMA